MKKLLSEKKDIISWLSKYGVSSYRLVEDPQYGYLVQATNSVFLQGLQLSSIDVQFQYVEGDFFCDDNSLTSLRGAPATIGGNFVCDNNELTSFQYGPTIIHGSLYADNNIFASLEHCPKYVHGDFSSNGSPIVDFTYIPEYVGGHFSCRQFQGCLYPFENVENFSEIERIVAIMREKESLASITSNRTPGIHKL